MEMAYYIISIFKHYLNVVWSWGFESPVALENGLQFRVNGYKHQGKVQVLYDEGYDLFTVKLLNRDGSVKTIEDGIYLDGLVDTIDRLVEKTDDYAARVRRQYGM